MLAVSPKGARAAKVVVVAPGELSGSVLGTPPTLASAFCSARVSFSLPLAFLSRIDLQGATPLRVMRGRSL